MYSALWFLCRVTSSKGRLHLKLKTIHKSLCCPSLSAKRQSSMPIFTKTCEGMQVKHVITQITHLHVLQIHVFASFKSPHYFAWFVVCFPNTCKIKLYYMASFPIIEFYLRYKCETFLGAWKLSIEICLLCMELEGIFIKSSALSLVWFM